jgi:hypothetical protein
MAFQWSGYNALQKPQGVSLNYVPQQQVIGSPQNAANLAAMNAALHPAPPPVAPVAANFGVPSHIGMPNFPSRFSPVSGYYATAANNWNTLKPEQQTPLAYMQMQDYLKGIMSQGAQGYWGGGHSGR